MLTFFEYNLHVLLLSRRRASFYSFFLPKMFSRYFFLAKKKTTNPSVCKTAHKTIHCVQYCTQNDLLCAILHTKRPTVCNTARNGRVYVPLIYECFCASCVCKEMTNWVSTHSDCIEISLVSPFVYFLYIFPRVVLKSCKQLRASFYCIDSVSLLYFVMCHGIEKLGYKWGHKGTCCIRQNLPYSLMTFCYCFQIIAVCWHSLLSLMFPGGSHNPAAPSHLPKHSQQDRQQLSLQTSCYSLLPQWAINLSRS